MVTYPPRLSLAQTPTPLHLLERLSAREKGPRIWVKRDDQTGAATSGNKVRKLEFALARAAEEGCDTLVTCGGVQSNHCRTTALLGARLGLKVHLILRLDNEAEIQGNLLLDYLSGAEVTLLQRKDYIAHQRDNFAYWQELYRRQGRNPYFITTGASDATGVWGYVACAGELKEDFAHHHIAPELIVHATGSGGTQAGLTAGCALHYLPSAVVGIAVCDDAAYFQRKVADDLQVWRSLYGVDIDLNALSIRVDDRHIGAGYAIAGEEVFSCIRDVAALEGLILDPVYSGKAFLGLLKNLRSGEYRDCRDIVFVHTGGLFGLLAQQEKLDLSGD